jgi:hypothetical protein
MPDESNATPANWKALPPLEGGVFVAMVTEVLDSQNIPNMVKTDLEAGGLGMIIGTSPLGDPWRIFVPEVEYARAMEVYESLMGQDHAEDQNGESDPQ